MTTERLGYVLYPPRRHSEPGYPRMDVNLCTVPSELHFDPERIDVETCGHYGIENFTITHPWHNEKYYQIPAGYIHMEDRLNKVIEAFTFGGYVDIGSINNCTRCSFYSTAPILLSYQEQTPASIFIDEVEILLAERRAASSDHIEKYNQDLCQADPLTLYYACLKAVRDRLNHISRHQDEYSTRLIHIIKDELSYLEEASIQRPDTHRKLEDLL